MSYIAKNGRLYTSGASEALTLLDDKFSVNKSYSKGDSCIYNDYLWKFTSDKPAGEWDSSVVEQCRIMDIVDDVNGRLTAENNMPFRFAFDTNSGKYGYITESGGADTFNPFSGNPVIEIINSHFETGYKLTRSLTHTVNELEYKAYIAIVATAGGDNGSNANGTATITTTDTSCNITTLFDRTGGWVSQNAYSGYGVCQVVLITNIQNGYNITLKGDFKVAGAVSLVLLGIK